MSNFKKFLALVLATLMVASMMVISAPAASAYAPTGDYATDITLLSSLGVMLGDGESYKEKENVTRWQMALLIARIVTGEVGNEMWEAEKSEYFTDVKADHYPGAIDFCAEMGYIKGVGDNLFDPEANIIYQDALTMIVRLLGYETETTSYPWGYILQARTLGLTDEINTGNKTNLLREEVANLLAVSLYKPLAVAGKLIDTDATAEGTQTTCLMYTGLKGQKLGTYTLVAAPTAAYSAENADGVVSAATGSITYGALKFANYAVFERQAVDAEGNLKFDSDGKKVMEKYVALDYANAVSVDMMNVSMKDNIHINDYLGLTADLVAINVGTANETILATMHDVTYYDSHSYSSTSGSQKLTVNGLNYYPYLNYGVKLLKYNEVQGATANDVFVLAAFADANFAGKGRVILCNGGNDNDPTNDIIRFVPYNTVRALYAFNTKVTAANDTLLYGLAKNTAVTSYFEAMNGYEAVLTPTTVTESKYVKDENWVIGINAYADFKGALLEEGVAKFGSNDDMSLYLRKRKPTTDWKDAGTLAITEYKVAVLGDIANGVVHKGASYQIGDVTFVTVATPVEFGTGVAKINGITDEKIILGDTAYSVGYNSKFISTAKCLVANRETLGDDTKRVNGWYANFADKTFDEAVEANIYDEVTYYTADGVVIGIVGADEVVANPNNKDALVLLIADDGSNVTVNADGTISVVAFNLDTLKEETVKLGQINGNNYGTLINTFGLGIAANALPTGTVLPANPKAADIVTAAIKAGNEYVINYRGMNYVVIAVANTTDGVYDVSASANAYLDRVILNGAAATTPEVDADTTTILNFRGYTASALAINPYYVGTFARWTDVVAPAVAEPMYTFAEKLLTVDKETQYVIFANNGVVNTTGVLPAATGSSLTLSDAPGAIVLELSSDKIVIFNANASASTIAPYVGTPAVSTGTTTGGWYTLTWKTDYDSMTAIKVDDTTTYYNYLFKNMYNLSTQANEDVVISTQVYYSTPEEGIFGDNWTDGKNTPVSDKTHAAVRNLYDVWYIGNQLGAGAQPSSIYSWGLANGYNVGIIRAFEYNNPNKLVIDNVTFDCKEDGKYLVKNLIKHNVALPENPTDAQKAEAALTTDIVVSYSIRVMYQYKDNSTADSLRVASYDDFATDDFQRWAIRHPNNEVNGTTYSELVLYKIDDNGVAELLINWADKFCAYNALGAGKEIVDCMAKVADFE